MFNVYVSKIAVTKTNVMLSLNKESARKCSEKGGSSLDTHIPNLLMPNSLQGYQILLMFLLFPLKLALWVAGFIKIEWERVQYNVGFIGEKKAKEKPCFFNARSLQRHINHEEFQGLAQKPFCKCISWTKGQCSFQGRARDWFPAFFFKSLVPCQQTNIYSSWEKESHSTQLTRVWLLGRGASWHVPHQPAPKCTDLFKGLYWWWPQTDRACEENWHPMDTNVSASSWPAHNPVRDSWKVCLIPLKMCFLKQIKYRNKKFTSNRVYISFTQTINGFWRTWNEMMIESLARHIFQLFMNWKYYGLGPENKWALD